MGTGNCKTVPVTIKTPSNQIINAYKYVLDPDIGTYPYNMSSYTGVSSVFNSSKSYNCHGFAWYFCGKTSGISNEKAFLLSTNGVNTYAASSCYTQINFPESTTIYDLNFPSYYSQLLPGDIIVTVAGDGETGLNEGDYKHSMIIKTIDPNLVRPIIVLSKWGEYEVYEHYSSSCPYISTSYTSNTNVAVPCKVKVYRNSHYLSTNIKKDNSIVPSVLSNVCSYQIYRYYSYNQTAHKKVCDCGRSYVIENHSFVPYGTSKLRCSNCGLIISS